MSPDDLPIDFTTREWTINVHLCTVQARILNQIAQATKGTLPVDQVQHSIASQLRDTLQVSGCVILPPDKHQEQLISARFGASQGRDRTVSTDCIYSLSLYLNQYYRSELVQGRPVIISESETGILDEFKDNKVSSLLIVPLLYRQSYLGSLTLYQCEQQHNWIPEEIGFVQSIAEHWAIALTLAELEQQAQSELQASKARNRALLEAIPDAISRVTRDGLILDWKPSKNQALPLPWGEMIGKHLHQVLPTQVAGLIWEHVELALETNEIQIVEYQLEFKGKSCDFEARIVKSGADEVAVIMQDISERVQARALLEQVNQALEIRVQERTAALRTANQALKAEIVERQRAEEGIRFLHSITQAIFESQDFHTALSVALQKVCEATNWDFAEAWVPNADGSALEFNGAWYSPIESLEGFKTASQQLIFPLGKGLPGRIWASKRPEWQTDISSPSKEINLRTQLAREVGLKTALGIPIIANTMVLAVLVFYRFESRDEDRRLIERIAAATELGLMIQRKRTEGEIRQALTKEKELTELKSRFITMTSHEFRTPLTTIQSSAELLEHYGNRWTPEKKLTHLHRIQSSVTHMTRLLNDVLIIGKADAGKLQLNPMPLELDYFCRKLVEELQFKDTKQHVIIFTCECQLETEERQYGDMETQKDGDASTSLCASAFQFPIPCMDKQLLGQILDNLLSNAIKYSPAGSNIRLTLRRFVDRAIFKISDQGIGIPSEDQKRLFEAFHRATNVGTIPGTGLGLAIVKKCVDVHQGQIAVESEVGVGTTFTVTLPIYNSLSTHEKNSSH